MAKRNVEANKMDKFEKRLADAEKLPKKKESKESIVQLKSDYDLWIKEGGVAIKREVSALRRDAFSLRIKALLLKKSSTIKN
tara:strand:+ start:550 stop:795 length:246 start_codon:yes stop_codon:yes gene_type:complete